MKWLPGIIILIVVIIMQLIFKPAFILGNGKVAIIFQNSEKPVKIVEKPGIYFKLPNPIRKVMIFDMDLIKYQAEPTEIITSDNKSITLEYEIIWQVTDVIKFYHTFRSRKDAGERIDDIVYFELRSAMVQYSVTEVLGDKKKSILAEVVKKSTEKLTESGIEIIDCMIKAATFTPENEKFKKLKHLPYL